MSPLSGELPMQMSGGSLEIVRLSNNQISEKIPSAIRNLRNLQSLSLEMNKFSGEIPEEIFNLKLLLNSTI